MTIGDGHDLRSPRFAGDEVLEACNDKERILQRGDSGSAVKKVQQALIILGFPVPGVGANGIFGDETELAVRSYQESRGLKVDGVVGSETIGSLDNEFFTGVPEPSVSPTIEPQLSEVSTPLYPESPVRSPRASPLGPVGAPPVKVPRAPRVEAPEVKVPRPPTTTVVRSSHETRPTTPRTVRPPITPHVTRLSETVDDKGRKFHTAGTVSGNNSSFEAEAGKSIRLELSNLNVKESSVTVKTNTGEAKESVLLPEALVDFEFSAIEEPFIWRFYIETDSEDSLIEWKLYSNWVPGKSE
ncbi:peptidoglycan-binding protein [Methanosarcina sp. UBA5]|uniref:peptidoglycan-binding protein n=1 Tax=Methanosarcina sp. UBA5 TaxID=1915593 RepID=UPI0025E8EFA3|nr:peptidoglycan-binding protein [Methanosarcina sp. UBA5]